MRLKNGWCKFGTKLETRRFVCSFHCQCPQMSINKAHAVWRKTIQTKDVLLLVLSWKVQKVYTHSSTHRGRQDCWHCYYDFRIRPVGAQPFYIKAGLLFTIVAACLLVRNPNGNSDSDSIVTIVAICLLYSTGLQITRQSQIPRTRGREDVPTITYVALEQVLAKDVR